SSSAVAELISSSSAFGAGAIFDSEAFGAGAILLSDLAAGCAVWVIDGVAVMRPRVSAVARRAARVQRRIGCPSKDGSSNAVKLAANSWRRHGSKMNGR